MATDPLRDIAARLHEAAGRDKCICGKTKGHVGWLLCELPHLKERDG